MPRISLWGRNKTNDYYYSDKVLKDYVNQGGTGIYVHKYVGPAGGGDESTIDDLLFLENRSRKYSDHIYVMRGTYKPESSEFSLTQFGIYISNDNLFIVFHYTDMLDIIGRKLMSGDVLEIPHMVDPDTLNPDLPTTRKFYVVEDAVHASEGYGVNWWSHLWRVKAKIMLKTPEFESINNSTPDPLTDPKGYDVGFGASQPSGGAYTKQIGPDGEPIEGGATALSCCDTGNQDQEITDAIIREAYENVRFDPKWFDDTHLYIEQDDEGKWVLYPWIGDGIPPNGQPLSGEDVTFPDDAEDGDFFLRIDFVPPRLFQKNGNIWGIVEADLRKVWTAYNRVLDTFIDNTDTTTYESGEKRLVRRAVSKLIAPRINLHESKEQEIMDQNNGKPK